MNEIRLGNPYIVRNNNKSRLECKVNWLIEDKAVEKVIFFEVDKEYEQYYVTDRIDAFLLAVIEIGMENGGRIVFETPATQELLYQLETYLIPIYAKNIAELKVVSLEGPSTTDAYKTKGVTGTGFSAGVDSFYSVLKHMNAKYSSFNVTHLLLTVNGAADTGYTEEKDQKWFSEEMQKFSGLAAEMGLELIGVYSNISLLNHDRKYIKGGDGIVTSGFVHALGKLFGTYYWASGYPADVLEFRTDDICYSEPFFLPLLSTRQLKFYHSGSEATRVEKIAFIADNPIVQKGLTVCCHPVSCGVCYKCTRTMADLYSIGKLDAFSNIFPKTETYKRRLSYNLGRELAQDHPPFTNEIIESFRKNGLYFPITAYIWKWLWFKPYLFFKNRLRYNKTVMKIYYKCGVADLLGEYKPSDAEINARLSGERYYK